MLEMGIDVFQVQQQLPIHVPVQRFNGTPESYQTWTGSTANAKWPLIHQDVST